MPTFDSALLDRLKYLSLVARRTGGRSLLAAPRRKVLGGGTEVTGVRDYAAGDDYRSIHWPWCARRDELVTKTFEGEEDLHVYVLLDGSRSMGLGDPAKFHLARRIAAALAYRAATNLDRLAVLAFADGIVAEGPPLRHVGRLPRLLRFLEGLSPQGTHTSLGRTVETFIRRCRRPGPTVVISDLYDRDGFPRALDLLRHRGYEPRLVRVHEADEFDPGPLGDVELLDVEGGTCRRVTITERAAQQYGQLLAGFRRSVRDYCTKHSIDYIPVANNTPEDEALLRVLGGTGKGSSTEGVAGPAVCCRRPKASQHGPCGKSTLFTDFS